MANVSIKERILRQIRTTCASVTGADSAYRWDTGRWYTGSAWVEVLPRDSIQVTVESDDVTGETIGGNAAPVTKTMNVSITVKLIRDSDDTESYDTLTRRWERNIEAGLIANRRIVEAATSVRLAIDSRFVSLPPPSTDSGQAEVVPNLTYQIEYRHDRNNPSALTGAISAVTE